VTAAAKPAGSDKYTAAIRLHQRDSDRCPIEAGVRTVQAKKTSRLSKPA